MRGAERVARRGMRDGKSWAGSALHLDVLGGRLVVVGRSCRRRGKLGARQPGVE